MGGRFKWLLWGSLGLIGLAVALGGPASAAYATPGTGINYTLDTLEQDSGGEIQIIDVGCEYEMQDTITISYRDTLTIAPGCTIHVLRGPQRDINFTIAGRLIIAGTVLFPVVIDDAFGSPAEGDFYGITFLGPGSGPSVIDNLTMRNPAFGLRCLSCQNLTARRVYVEKTTGDGILVRGGSNLTFENITLSVTTYQSQSVIGITGASGVSIVGASGTNVADLLTLWNITNVMAVGPIVGTNVTIAGAWIDNATNVSVSGVTGDGFGNGFRITRSTGVNISNCVITNASAYGLNATGIAGLRISAVTFTGGNAPKISVFNVSTLVINNATLGSTGYVLAINNSGAITVNDSWLSGGNPASSYLLNCWPVVFSNVTAQGGTVGFLFLNVTVPQLNALNATGAAGDGIRATGAVIAGGSLADSTVSLNGGSGLALTSGSAWAVNNTTVDGNGGWGVAVNGSSLFLGNSTVRGNSLGGILVVNDSAVAGSLNLVAQNGGEGLWVLGGTNAMTKSTFRGNSGNGIRVDIGYLGLEDGLIENNTLAGIRVGPVGSCYWTASTTAVLTSEEVWGVTLVAGPGTFQVFNALIHAVNVTVGSAGILWLDHSFVNGSAGIWSWSLKVASGGTLAANVVSIDTPANLSVVGGAVDWRQVDVNASSDAMILTGSTATMSDVIIQGPGSTGIDLRLGSTLVAINLLLRALSRGIVSANSEISLTDSQLTVSLGVEATLSNITFQNVTANGGAVRLDAGHFAFVGLSMPTASAAIWLSNSTMDGDGLVGSAGGGRIYLLHLDGSSAKLSNSTVDTIWTNFAFSVNNGSSLTLRNVTLAGCGLCLYAADSAVDGWDFDASGDGPAKIYLSAATLTLTASKIHDGSGEGIAATNGSTVDLTDTQLGPFSDEALRTTGGETVRLVNVSMESQSVTYGVDIESALLFSAQRTYLWAGAGGVSLRNVQEVVLDGFEVDADRKALEILNAAIVTLTAVTLDSTSELGFEAADIGAFGASQVTVNGSLGAVVLARITGMSWTGAFITAAAGSPLVLDASPFAAIIRGSLSGNLASVVTASPDARLDGLTLSTSGLSITSSARFRFANSTVLNAGVVVTTTLDFVAYNVSFALSGGQTGIALGANSSADLGRITVGGGLYGVNGAGGPYLRVRNSAFSGASNTSVLARSYAQVTIFNASSSGAASGFDVRYTAGANLTNITVTGSTVNGVNVERSDNATVWSATLSPASGTALRIAMSAGVRVERAAVTGGTTAFMFHNSTGAWVTNSTSLGASKGVVAGSGSSGHLRNVTMQTLSSQGAVAYNNSSIDLWTSTIVRAPLANGFQAANATSSSTIRLFDSHAENTTFSVSSGGAIEVYWSLQVTTRAGGNPLPGVLVLLTNAKGVQAASLTTGAGGNVSIAALIELRDTTAGRDYSSPYTASSDGAGGLTGATAFDLNTPASIFIDLSDAEGPNLEVRTFRVQRIAFNDTFTFGPNPFDGDNIGIDHYEWNFTDETGAPRTLTGDAASFFTAAYRFGKAGHYPVTVRAFDAAGNPSAPLLEVEVWVNDPPFFLHPPTVLDLAAFTGVLFQVDLRASDMDAEDIPNLNYSQTGLTGATFSNGFLFWTPSTAAPAAFTVSVGDRFDTVSATFSILVGRLDRPNDQPPFFASDPVEAADIIHDYVYAVAVDDADLPRDTVIIQLVAGPPGMTLTQGDPSLRTAQLSWRPGLEYKRTAEPLFLNFTISLRAFDGFNFTYQNFTLALKNPPDKPPAIVDFGNLTLGPGQIQRLDLLQFATDEDDFDLSTMRWSIVKPNDTQGATIGFDTENSFVLIITAPGQLQGTQSFYITFIVTDTSGLSATRLVRVDLVGPTVVETAFPLLLVLILVGGVGAAFAIATRQRAAALAEEAAAAPKGGGPSTGTVQATAPAAGAGFPFYLEGAALYESLESLIAHVEVDGVDLEDTWVLLPSKAREASLADGVLRVVRLQEHDVALLRDGDATVAAVGLFAGDPSAWLEDPMKEAAKEVQGRVAETNAVNLEGLSNDAAVADALRGLLALSGGSSREAVGKYLRDSGLRAGSVVELVEGLVRLKVAVDNNSGQLAADAKLSVEYDDKVMRIERIEPALEQKRDKVHLGNLRPGERKTVAFYFDPQICTKSFFNATVTWDDSSGGFHSTSMRTRPAEVVCPAFSTAQSANTAMLKRLLKEELSFRDSKYFRFPARTSASQVFEACKQAVLAQDVRLVKEIVNERPYRAEAWFFGETKVKHSPMVIWTAVFGDERVAQFSAASNAQASITGLLAELGRRLVHSRAGGGVGAPIEAVAKSSPAAAVGERPSLLSKSDEAEADSP